METAVSLQRCTRVAMKSLPTRRIPTSSNSITQLRRAGSHCTSRDFSSTCRTQQSKPPQPANNSSQAPRPSIKDLLRDLRQREPTRGGSGRSASDRMDALLGRKTPTGAAGSRISNFADIMGSGSGGSGEIDQDKMLEELSHELHEGSTVSLRLRPTLGRTVEGLYGDPARGIRLLERKCSDNRVRGDARTQMTHVRRGQRKKDMRRQRWRKLFKEGFVAECDRIRRMRKQGW